MKTTMYVFALLLIGAGSFAQSKDEAAIKAMLVGHSQASLDNDAERAISYFADVPYAAITWQDPGSGYVRGKAVQAKYREVLNRPGRHKKSPDKITTGDYLFRIVGNTAFVTCIETVTKPDGTTERTHKANYLEKEGSNGSASQWKLVGNFWMPEMKAK